jgi:hypothetical protein
VTVTHTTTLVSPSASTKAPTPTASPTTPGP